MMPTRITRALESLRSLERRCILCSQVLHPALRSGVPGSFPFCATCLDALPRKEHGHCPLCGEPAPWSNLNPCLCGRCLEERPPWENFIFHGLYEGRLRELLLTLKFKGGVQLGYALGTLLANHPLLSPGHVDMIVPVPLHHSRLVQRGNNQSLEIARPLASYLAAPLSPHSLVRVKATAPQSGLSLQRRRDNIKDAFSASPEVREKQILLVDDTLTTGATLEAAATSLLQSGAAGISIAVVSRTPRRLTKIQS